MIALSSRHAAAVLALVGLAGVPIAWHAIADPVVDSCRGAATLLESARIGQGHVTQRRLDPRRGPARIDGAIGVRSADVREIAFRIARGADPSDFYGSTQVVAFEHTFPLDMQDRLFELDTGDTRLPVYWLEDGPEPHFRVRAHLYVMGGRPVESVFRSGLAIADTQLVEGTLPVTAFMIRADGRSSAAEDMREAVEAWLRAAWQHYREVCGP